jgi:hypothetical protein
MIIDIFLGFNEIRLAEFRIRYLSSRVDHTIIGEARTTHSGVAKRLFFKEWFETLDSSLKSKVTLVEIPLDNFDDSWQREIGSREFLAEYAKLNFPGTKFVLSDLDEIPSISQLDLLKENSGIFHFTTPTYYRRANWRLKDKHATWARGVCGEIQLLQAENGGRFSSYPLIGGEPGVHLSYLGMSDIELRDKITSFAHTELLVNRFAADGIIDFCDNFRINHLGQSRAKGFGLFEISKPESKDLWNMILVNFPDLVDDASTLIPGYGRRFWASVRLSVYLSRQSQDTSSQQDKSFREEISSSGLIVYALFECIVSVLYSGKRFLQIVSGRLFK